VLQRDTPTTRASSCLMHPSPTWLSMLSQSYASAQLQQFQVIHVGVNVNSTGPVLSMQTSQSYSIRHSYRHPFHPDACMGLQDLQETVIVV
jgi:hypothetical protein